MPALSQKKSAQDSTRHYLFQLKNTSGFTLLELMVVIAIMGILASVLVLNLNTTRASRDIKIAQNLLVSNLRKTQSYTLSARTLPSGDQVEYYLLKFDTANNPTQYTIQAIYNADTSSPKLADVETVSLPPNIKIASIAVTQRPVIPATQDTSLPSPAMSCVLAGFAAPFGKLIFNDGCRISAPPAINTSDLNDDYNKIMSFQINVACGLNNYGVPSICTASTDSVMLITLTDVAGTISNKILINGITGAICPTLDNTTCAASF